MNGKKRQGLCQNCVEHTLVIVDTPVDQTIQIIIVLDIHPVKVVI